MVHTLLTLHRAGIGNIFLGDDPFGVEVMRRLALRPFPAGAEVRDFGIRGFDLACALQWGYDAVILVGAIQRHGPRRSPRHRAARLEAEEPATLGPSEGVMGLSEAVE